MNVDIFVRKTLQQIIAGVGAAQAGKAVRGAVVNPSGFDLVDKSAVIGFVGGVGKKVPVISVDFDIALSVVEDGKGSTIVAVSGTPNRANGAGADSISRVRFRVPLALPRPGQAAAAAKAKAEKKS
jgi:hypothetical protein